jgi:ADP-ribose pyrophosphatase YjhB (NUDIX family)
MTDRREYPERPIVGVGAVIAVGGKIVLIRRRFEPLKGHWSLPGGAVELGETLEAAIGREVQEETGFEVEVGPVIEVFDRITMDHEDRVQYHYVLVDYLCWPIGGTLRAGSDVDDAVLADPGEFAVYELTEKAMSVIERALQLDRTAPRSAR